MKKTVLGVIIALTGYVVGCKASYDLGYTRGHKTGVLDFMNGWEMAKYVYNKPIKKEEETTDKEKSE